jgi:hypothetical protein
MFFPFRYLLLCIMSSGWQVGLSVYQTSRWYTEVGRHCRAYLSAQLAFFTVKCHHYLPDSSFDYGSRSVV